MPKFGRIFSPENFPSKMILDEMILVIRLTIFVEKIFELKIMVENYQDKGYEVDLRRLIRVG